RLRPCERAGRDRAQAPEHVGRPRSVRLSDAALTTEWARLLLGMLAQSGVREAVISPGSRSTPFTFAALREPTLRCHDIVDGRSAAFFALGQAKVSGEPTLLLCTSGSAAANYLPAVVEANNSHTPLLLLTADRPLELQDCSAHQTIAQNRPRGHHARGQAKVSGEPTLRLCTSGSAAAHALRAVVESNTSHAPLLILTAHRPLELQDCSARQTSDQTRPFGQHARAFFELGAPDAAP